MNSDQLENRIKTLDELEDMKFNDPHGLKGRVIEPSQSMGTVLGRKVHVKSSNSTSDVVFGLCGAGLPNRKFPSGSAVVLRDPKDERNGEPLGIIVDCYKCMKLMYINEMKAQDKTIPVREFTPSNQQPGPSSWGETVEFDALPDYCWADVKYALQRGNLFILFSKFKIRKKRIRRHIMATDAQVPKIIEILREFNISIKQKAPIDFEEYKRRQQHIMIPMGRYGILGSNTVSQAIEIDGEYDEVSPENYLREVFPQFDDLEEMEYDLSWVEEYFNATQNKWKVGANERRRTQQKKKSKDKFEVTTVEQLLRQMGFDPFADLPVKEERRLNLLKDKIQIFKDILGSLDIKSLYLMAKDPPRSTSARTMLAQAIRDRKEEYDLYLESLVVKRRRKNSSKHTLRVLPMLDRLSSLDTLFVRLEKNNVKSGRQSRR
jgi:hypothetical protein